MFLTRCKSAILVLLSAAIGSGVLGAVILGGQTNPQSTQKSPDGSPREENEQP
jgi:hypothetical protein